MKRIIIPLLLIFLLSSCSADISDNNRDIGEEESVYYENAQYVRALWFPYYEFGNLIKNRSKSEFTKAADEMLDDVSEKGFNTLCVQVRAFADAFYVSDIFPSSSYCFDFQGADMPYDPFEIICASAQSRGINIEAWINPYRVSNKNDLKELSEDNIARIWSKSKKKKSNVYVSDAGIYFNPASEDVTGLIVRGVREVLSYDITAVHFDDYFYPTQDSEIDEKEYSEYVDGGGTLSLSDFRRERVSQMIKRVYRAVHSAEKNVRFGISPAADADRNRNVLFADTEKWVTEEGYVDYICPQVYFGFRNEYLPFMSTVKKWMKLAKCDIYIGLPLYKAGKTDKYASSDSAEIRNEFKNSSDIIARQITYLSKLDEIDGFYVFSYGCMSEQSCHRETENMLAAMQSSSRQPHRSP